MASDIGFNKYLLGLSPKNSYPLRHVIRHQPGRLRVVVAGRGAVDRHLFGGLGAALQPYSLLVAIVALVMPPILAAATKASTTFRRTHDGIDLPMYDEHGTSSPLTLAMPATRISSGPTCYLPDPWCACSLLCCPRQLAPSMCFPG